MHVTLIRPSILRPAMNMVDLVTPPLGLAYVGAAIRNAGHSVTVVDAIGSAIEQFTAHPRGHLHGLTIDEIVASVPAATDAIGVSVQYSYDCQLRKNGRIANLDDEFFYRLASYADIRQTYSYCEALGRRILLTLRVIGTLIFYSTSWLVRPWRPLVMVARRGRPGGKPRRDGAADAASPRAAASAAALVRLNTRLKPKPSSEAV